MSVVFSIDIFALHLLNIVVYILGRNISMTVWSCFFFASSEEKRMLAYRFDEHRENHEKLAKRVSHDL